MGWMMVPLTQYHGGGAVATIEPLKDHLPHYEARMADLFGAGVQACYRGPRIYDTDETKELVKKWITFYKRHRQVLDADIVHLRRPDGRDWDWLRSAVEPAGHGKALLPFFYNPLSETIEREIHVPLYYSGLTGKAKMTREDGSSSTIDLDNSATATVKDWTIPAPRARQWCNNPTPRTRPQTRREQRQHLRPTTWKNATPGPFTTCSARWTCPTNFCRRPSARSIRRGVWPARFLPSADTSIRRLTPTRRCSNGRNCFLASPARSVVYLPARQFPALCPHGRALQRDVRLSRRTRLHR